MTSAERVLLPYAAILPVIEIHPLAPALGAEIRGVDARRPLDIPARDAIMRGWLGHLVPVLRGFIMGMPLADSEALLNALWSHAAKPEFAFAHRWRAGDLRRDPFDAAARRLLHPTQIREDSAAE